MSAFVHADPIQLQTHLELEAADSGDDPIKSLITTKLDGGTNVDGWYVDDVRTPSCVAPLTTTPS